MNKKEADKIGTLVLTFLGGFLSGVLVSCLIFGIMILIKNIGAM